MCHVCARQRVGGDGGNAVHVCDPSLGVNVKRDIALPIGPRRYEKVDAGQSRACRVAVGAYISTGVYGDCRPPMLILPR